MFSRWGGATLPTERLLISNEGVYEKTKGLKIAALIFPGIPLASLLLFAIGEPVGRNWSGLGHLIEAIPVALLMWVGWVADYNDPDNFLRKIFH